MNRSVLGSIGALVLAACAAAPQKSIPAPAFALPYSDFLNDEFPAAAEDVAAVYRALLRHFMPPTCRSRARCAA